MRILWADYAWPNTDANDIAATFNAALKLAGQCKQTVSMDNAEALVAACDDHRHRFLGHQERGIQRPQRRCPLRHLGSNRKLHSGESRNPVGAKNYSPLPFCR